MTAELTEQLAADMGSVLDVSYDRLYEIPVDELSDLHLRAAQAAFARLRPRLPVLDKLADEQQIREIRTFDDVAPLLFPHTVYKSYPVSNIERNRYDRMTKWLQSLATADLSNVDATGIESIDEWMDELDRSTDLWTFHTSGTSGKLSFLPRTWDDWRRNSRLGRNARRDFFGANSRPDSLEGGLPMICPSYEHGASAVARGMKVFASLAKGGDDILYLYPDARFSADVASLSGRLKVAEARGEQGQLAISPALMKRRDEIAALERERPAAMQRFFETVRDRFGGQDVQMTVMWAVLYDWAEAGLQRGFHHQFGPGSLVMTGGGPKGAVLPDDWRERVYEFLGFDRLFEMYACSETMEICLMCEAGVYHVPPMLVPIVVDPATGEVVPRRDPQVGRMGMLDTLGDSYWGGLLTGDEVTVRGWDESCSCGRTGPYVVPPIRRYSDSEGGDDKIMCGGAPEAHDKAMEFLANLSD